MKGRSLAGSNTVVARTLMAYDGQNHTIQLTDPNNNATTYAYDGSNNLIHTTDPLSKTTTNDYAPVLFRPTRVTDPQSATVGYSYDPTSNITQLTYPDGRTVSYTYDALNRVKTVSIDWLSKAQLTIMMTLGVLPASPSSTEPP